MTRAKSIMWSVGTVVVSAAISFAVVRLTQLSPRSVESESSSHQKRDLHQWLHENLEITLEQEKALLAIETQFESDRVRLRDAIESAGEKLAEAIRDYESNSSEVTIAREELTRVQGELQQVTLDHFFEMKEHLNSKQRAKLLTWTHQSILNGYNR